MSSWKQQGNGLVASLTLSDGTEGRVVLVGPRSDPEGAMVVLIGNEQGSVESLPLTEVLDRVPPDTAVSILCAQERHFGDSKLPAVDVQ
ncbi:MAG: hypothetical protein R6V12_13135 [Candidatus Hydrogenedentota bacterium]